MQDFFKQIWQVIVDSNLLNVVGAVLILLIGWLIALYASRRISGSLQKLTVRKDILPDGAEVPRISHADTLTGKIIYYVIMIFAVLGCFSVLNLNYPERDEALGLKATSLRTLRYLDDYEPEIGEDGETRYTLVGGLDKSMADGEDDYTWLKRGYATMTVLTYDLTHDAATKALEGRI